jgi:AcrR family transcriptional regulator
LRPATELGSLTRVTEAITEDRRVVRTRTALHQALMDLIAEREYDDITVGDVIGRAGVGRSTFYQHYQNKDEVFRAIVMGGMEACADAAIGGERLAYLSDWLQIFWDNRRAGRVMLAGGPTRQSISRALAELLCERLERAAASGSRKPPAPNRLIAVQIAEGQLGLIQAWLAAVAAATPQALAEQIALSSQAQVRAAYG